jgi:hypothetical protein
VHGGTEYLFRGLGAPISAVADARYHASGNYTFTVGIKGYFGGNDDNKSLILRHRQDDPPDRAIDLFTAAGSQLFDKAPGAPTDPEAVCLAQNDTLIGYDPEFFYYFWDSEGCHLFNDL